MNRRFVVTGALLALAVNLLACEDDRRRATSADAGRAARDSGAALARDSGAAPRIDAGSAPSCMAGPENSAAACSDGCSNDGDTFVDCDDRDCCDVTSGCPASTYCGGRVDAGSISSCVSGPETTRALCSDGCSNDGDAYVDCNDYDCCDLVACPPASACGMVGTTPSYVSRNGADCVGHGTVSHAFSSDTYDVVTVAFATSAGYQVFGYTRGSIESGPFPLTGMSGERQVRVADIGSGLQMALSSWGGTSWTSSEGGSAAFSEDSTASLAPDASTLYATYACVGYVEGRASAGVSGGVDFLYFDFVAPVLGLGFPGVRP